MQNCCSKILAGTLMAVAKLRHLRYVTGYQVRVTTVILRE